MTACPCNSGRSYASCCAPYILGHAPAPNAEALMRSRYTAYTGADTNYIQRTMTGKAAVGFDPIDTAKWAKSVTFLGLTVENFTVSKTDSTRAYVKFFARLQDGNKKDYLYELSEFHFIDGAWFYVDGQHAEISKNQSCPCGSNKKAKRCCLA